MIGSGPGRVRLTVGVGLKLYLGVGETTAWTDRVVDLALGVPSIAAGRLQLWIAPSLPALPHVLARTVGTGVLVAAQNLCAHDRGAFTGEVSGADLAELGCTLVEIGHAERRRLFGEDDAVIAAKVVAAVRNGLVPVICVGEPEANGVEQAIAHSIRQLTSALAAAPLAVGPVIVAYEPVWAIGGERAAPAEHIRAVCTALRQRLGELGRPGDQVIYGGSAGPGTLRDLGTAVDGLFLGRFAHDPSALRSVLAEAEELLEAVCR